MEAWISIHAAWCYVLVWPVSILLTSLFSPRLGSRHHVDMSVLFIALLAEFVFALVGVVTSTNGCKTDGVLLISNNIGNIVSSASFGVACLTAYLTFTGPTLGAWISLEADRTLRSYGLKPEFRPGDRTVGGYAQQVFEACLELPLTIEELARKRLVKRRGALAADPDVERAREIREQKWESACEHLKVRRFSRMMIEGRGDQWLASAAIWLMIFVTGQALILFMVEVFVGDQRVACWLSSARPYFGDLPIELSYIFAFFALLVGVGLFRFRTMVQDKIRHSMNAFADDLSLQLLVPQALDNIDRAGKS